MSRLVSTIAAFVLFSLHSSAQKTEIKQVDGAYALYRDGKPYYIKGAGGFSHYDELKACGGNSIRTWSEENAQQVLDELARSSGNPDLAVLANHARNLGQ